MLSSPLPTRACRTKSEMKCLSFLMLKGPCGPQVGALQARLHDLAVKYGSSIRFDARDLRRWRHRAMKKIVTVLCVAVASTQTAFGLAATWADTHDWTVSVSSNEYGLRETAFRVRFGNGPYESSYRTQIIFASHEVTVRARLWECLAVPLIVVAAGTTLGIKMRGRHRQQAAPPYSEPAAGSPQG